MSVLAPSRSLRTALLRALFFLGALLSLAADAAAQDDRPRVHRAISIGPHPRVDGIRINYRDQYLDLVRGVNVTVWTPYEGDWSGTVRGLALGLPSTGAERIEGIGLGILGVAASDELHGIAFGLAGVGSGGRVRGIAIGGLGVGAGESVTGVAGGLLGVGTGGDVTGIAFGGLGAGAGGNATGILIAGLGAGVGGDLRWIAIGGLGVGAGGDARGLLLGGLGVGAGGDVTGIAASVVGVGAGGTLKGFAFGGIGVGAPRIEGIAIGSAVGAEEVQGFVFAPALFRTSRGGRITGTSLSAFNQVRGDVHGVSIGLINYAWSLNGVQIGVINVVRDNPRGRQVLPVVNW